MILTDIGEVGVYYEGLELFLSPSLYAMSRLGNPKEIVDTFHYVMNGSLPHSLAVIQVCADDDIRQIFGEMIIDGESISFNQMFASAGEIIILAQSLMKHGIIGDVKHAKKRASKKDYTNEFHAKEYVAAAVAHLGISTKDAWGMTMTSLSGAMQSKYPSVDQEEDLPTVEELRAADSWLDEVNKRR